MNPGSPGMVSVGRPSGPLTIVLCTRHSTKLNRQSGSSSPERSCHGVTVCSGLTNACGSYNVVSTVMVLPSALGVNVSIVSRSLLYSNIEFETVNSWTFSVYAPGGCLFL